MQGIAERDYYRTHPLTDERISFVEKRHGNRGRRRKGLRKRNFKESKPNCLPIPKNRGRRFSNIRPTTIPSPPVMPAPSPCSNS